MRFRSSDFVQSKSWRIYNHLSGIIGLAGDDSVLTGLLPHALWQVIVLNQASVTMTDDPKPAEFALQSSSEMSIFATSLYSELESLWGGVL